MGSIFTILGVIAVFGFGLLQLGVGFHGLEVQFGTVWAYVGAGLAFLRITPPIMLGAYFGAIEIWDIHPVLAVLFALPGLLLMVPGIVGAAFSALRR
jgi:hypothetical protein